jgi:hypothetical protein
MRSASAMLIGKAWARPAFLGPRRKHSWRRCLLISLALPSVLVALIRPSVGQETPHREFSANVLMRMGTEKSGSGARVYVKEDNVYLDFPDLAHGRHIPVWFLSDGVVVSVKEAWSDEDSNDEAFNPGPSDPFSSGDPFSVGFFLRFRPTNPNRLCEELRSYYIEFMQGGGRLRNEDLKNLQKPDNFRCEQTGHEMVTVRDCRTYRLASGLSEYWITISFDPKLTAILQVQWNPPQGLILRLDAIKEGPQPSSLFVPPPDHIVVVDPKKPGHVARE